MEEVILKINQTKQAVKKGIDKNKLKTPSSQISHSVGCGGETALPGVCLCVSPGAPVPVHLEQALKHLEAFCPSSDCAVSVFTPLCTSY